MRNKEFFFFGAKFEIFKFKYLNLTRVMSNLIHTIKIKKDLNHENKIYCSEDKSFISLFGRYLIFKSIKKINKGIKNCAREDTETSNCVERNPKFIKIKLFWIGLTHILYKISNYLIDLSTTQSRDDIKKVVLFSLKWSIKISYIWNLLYNKLM